MLASTILFGLIGLFIIGGGVVCFIIIYNGLIRLRKNIDKAWSNINILLKQRNNELPKLIDTVKQYMNYEKKVLKQLTKARTKVQKANTPKENAEADKSIRGALTNLFAVAEDYPELQADDSFKQLQNRISALEEQLSDRREFYNDSVNTYNIRINQIPYNLVASLLNYTEKELFKVKESEKKDIDISEQFKK